MKTFLLCASLFLTTGTASSFAQSKYLCRMRAGMNSLLSRQIAKCRHVVLVRYAGHGKTGTKDVSFFRVTEVLSSKGDQVKINDRLTLPKLAKASLGDQFTVMTNHLAAGWFLPEPADDVFWQYLHALPAPVENPEQQAERAAFFIPWLEHANARIAEDAAGELAALPFEVLSKLKDQFPREKLRQWITSRDHRTLHSGLYPICLSICGDSSDVRMLKQIALGGNESPDQTGICFALLVLDGAEGLRFLEERRLRRPKHSVDDPVQSETSFSQTYCAMQALSMAWETEPEVLSKEQLRQSMHLLLDRPEFSDLVIAALTRWEDWPVQNRLMSMYDAPEFDIPATRRAIVRFMIACSRQESSDGDKPSPSGESARKNLQTLQARDPETVRQVLKFMVPSPN